MPRSELLELSRSCYHTVLARVSTLLTGLRVMATAPPPAAEGDAVAAIPVSLPGSKLFAVLPHLLCPGAWCTRICRSSFGFGRFSWIQG